MLFAERLDGRRGGHARSDSYLGLGEAGGATRGAGLVGAIAGGRKMGGLKMPAREKARAFRRGLVQKSGFDCLTVSQR